MAFDISNAARLIASIIYHQHRFEAGEEPCYFWETHSKSAVALANLIGIRLQLSETSEALSRRIFDELDCQRELCQKLESNFPNLAFAPLIKKLADRLAQPDTAGKSRGNRIKRFARILTGRSVLVPVTEILVELLGKGATLPDAEILAVALFFNHHAAARTALAFDEGLPFPWTQFRELEAISKARAISITSATARGTPAPFRRV